MRSEEKLCGQREEKRKRREEEGRKMRGEERQVGRGERKGTWLEINRNVTIFHQTRGPSPSNPFSPPSLLRFASERRSFRGRTPRKRRKRARTRRETREERFCRWLCVHAVGKRSGARAGTRVYPPSGRCLAWMKKSRG